MAQLIPFSSILVWLGAFAAIYLAAVVADFVWIYNKPSRLDRYLRRGGPDGTWPAWAVVTGASSGIGKALSNELAARGFNVVLHGRNPSKLAGVQRELEAAHPTRSFRLLVADAARCLPRPDTSGGDDDIGGDRKKKKERETEKEKVVDLDAVAAQLADIHITILINNAGGGAETGAFGLLDDYTRAELLDTVYLNGMFPMLLLHALLPLLTRDGGPALVINVGSLADLAMPYLASYAASKNFMRTITTCLAREAGLGRSPRRRSNLEALYVRTGEVTGAGPYGHRSVTWARPDAETYARCVLARVGCGRPSVVPYWPQGLQILLMESLPRWAQDAAAYKAVGAQLDMSDVTKRK